MSSKLKNTKNSFSLIELIFTIVIIALIFTTIPKIIYSSNKTFEYTLKQDVIFNMMSKMVDVTIQEWDENNTNSQDDYQYNILITGNDNILECKSDQDPPIRVGGFYSGTQYSRQCRKKTTSSSSGFGFGFGISTKSEDITISHIGTDSDENSEEDYDDEDDYNSTVDEITQKRDTYKLYVQVCYTQEWDENNYNNQTLDFNFSSTCVDKSNIKFIKVTLEQDTLTADKNISNAKYWGANIGKIQEIESEQW